MGRRFKQRVNATTLTPAQASRGIAAAIRTARGLLSDGALLLEKKRWQRAAALSILAIEEMGKVEILRSILLARSEEELMSEWRAYHNHKKKNPGWILLDLVRGGAKKFEHFKPIVDPRSDHSEFLERIKQECLYSNISPTGDWSSPEQKVGVDVAKATFEAAMVLVPRGALAMTSEEELELWVKHLRPVWRGSMEQMKKALVACYTEAEARGLLPADTTAAGMLDFLFGDSVSQDH